MTKRENAMKNIGLIAILVGILGFVLIFTGNGSSFASYMVFGGLGLGILIFVIDSQVQSNKAQQRIYTCASCGTKLTYDRLRKLGNACPRCGGNVFS
jgi:DNA-directed RNA polymerase subunit RPC12/RpoP